MFESLSDRLGGVFDRLRGRGALNENDVREAMREVRVALLEADVALPVVREFVDKRHRTGGRPVGSQIGHPGPAGRQDRQ
jgi:signal recognition particle GTPase